MENSAFFPDFICEGSVTSVLWSTHRLDTYTLLVHVCMCSQACCSSSARPGYWLMTGICIYSCVPSVYSHLCYISTLRIIFCYVQ